MTQSILAAIISSVTASIIFFIFQMIIRYIDKKKKNSQIEDRSQKDAIQAILMSQLEDKHDAYLECGYATMREKTIYDKMYKSYHNLGKNGVMTHAYDEVMNLPSNPKN